MKKILSYVLIVTMLSVLSAAMPACAASFWDLSETHWAYADIMSLVSDGTINGYDNGAFLPEGTVTRAEFVKMLGKSDNFREGDFDDVPKDHWCYEYIMYSGLDPLEGNTFAPDTPILRLDVANLLYSRFSGGAAARAPRYIASQSANPNAAAWVYSLGLMTGDDMLNLRLGDSLTRAEAAALIVRAKNVNPDAQRNFIDNFSDDVYQMVYNSSNLFDTPYEADANISNGEVAAAALRYRFRDRSIPLGNYYYTKNYDGDYAAEWNIMCTYVLPEGKYSSSEAESKSNATVGDALAMISHGALYNTYVNAGENPDATGMYPELTVSAGSENARVLKYAYNFGISLYANGVLNADRPITKKELACILMQYDLSMGINIAYRCGYNCTYVPTPLEYDLGAYPSNKEDFTAILSDVPKIVYETPFNGANVTDKSRELTGTVNSLARIFTIPLNMFCENAYNDGIEMYISFYPSIMSKTPEGYIYRVKLEFASLSGERKLSDIFTLGDGAEDITISAGDEFWIDLATNANISSLYIDYSLMTVEQIIR